MQCGLCKNESVLIKKSHIIPRFMYKDLFEEDYIIIARSNDLDKHKKIQTGIFEKNILCQNCDNIIIGSLEDYAKRLLYGGRLKNKPSFYRTVTRGRLKKYTLLNVDYKSLKLFILSILWRASISKADFFRGVDLGPHEERIRKMILNHDSGPDSIYQFCMMATGSSAEVTSRLIVAPKRIKRNGNTFYALLINQLVFLVNISELNKLELFENTWDPVSKTLEIPILEGKLLNKHLDGIIGTELRLS